MLLSFRSRVVSVAFGTVSFFMADENRTIRVDIPKELLARIEDPPAVSKEEYVARLARHRRHFAQIAALKYLGGLYVPEVNVLVVRITDEDLSLGANDSPRG
jgi:hypothetical protein